MLTDNRAFDMTGRKPQGETPVMPVPHQVKPRYGVDKRTGKRFDVAGVELKLVKNKKKKNAKGEWCSQLKQKSKNNNIYNGIEGVILFFHNYCSYTVDLHLFLFAKLTSAPNPILCH